MINCVTISKLLIIITTHYRPSSNVLFEGEANDNEGANANEGRRLTFMNMLAELNAANVAAMNMLANVPHRVRDLNFKPSLIFTKFN